MMPQRRWSLVDKVRVGVRGRAHGVVQHVALAGDGGRAISPRSGEEFRLAERGAFPFGLALVFFFAIAGVAADAEEVLDLLGKVAVATIGVLASGRHAEARQMSLLVRERAWGGGVKESRHRESSAADASAAPPCPVDGQPAAARGGKGRPTDSR